MTYPRFLTSILIPLAISLFLFFAGCKKESFNTTQPQKLIIALKPNKDPDKTMAQRKVLENYLSSKLKQPVEVTIPLSSAVITEGFANGTLDLAFVSSTEAVKLVKKDLGSILLAVELKGNPFYLSYWVSLKDKPYESIEDLKGKPIAFSSRTSTSGFLIPIWDLYQRDYLNVREGPEGFFGKNNVAYGMGYVSAIRRVLNKEVEAAAVSYYVLDENRHLTEEERAQLKKVTSQGPVPTHSLVIRNKINQEKRILIEEVFLKLNEENPALRDKLFQSKLIKVNQENHLQSTREALEIISKMQF